MAATEPDRLARIEELVETLAHGLVTTSEIVRDFARAADERMVRVERAMDAFARALEAASREEAKTRVN
jgi:hypothetical protein